jgi:hypothetical protein
VTSFALFDDLVALEHETLDGMVALFDSVKSAHWSGVFSQIVYRVCDWKVDLGHLPERGCRHLHCTSTGS